MKRGSRDEGGGRREPKVYLTSTCEVYQTQMIHFNETYSAFKLEHSIIVANHGRELYEEL